MATIARISRFGKDLSRKMLNLKFVVITKWKRKTALLYDKTRVIMLNENTNIAFVNNNLLIKILNK